MKKGTKITLLTATTLVLVGFLVSVIALLASGFNFGKINTHSLTAKEYAVTETFTSITVNGLECDVKLIPSTDGVCKVLGKEGKNLTNEVTVVDDTLQIVRKDNRKWYQFIGFFINETDFFIYLPEKSLKNVTVTTGSGDIEIPGAFTFENATLTSASGEIDCHANVTGSLTAKAASGDIEMSNATAKTISVKAQSGEIELSNMQQAENVTVQSSSGDIELTDVIATNKLKLKAASGDIDFTRCDGGDIEISAASGDVKGSFLTGKTFTVTTGSGNKSYPKESTGAPCVITTGSGNVRVTVL